MWSGQIDRFLYSDLLQVLKTTNTHSDAPAVLDEHLLDGLDLNLDAVDVGEADPSAPARRASDADDDDDLVAFVDLGHLVEAVAGDAVDAEAAAAIEQQHAAIAAFGSTAAAAAVSLTVTAADVEAIDALVAEVLHNDGGPSDRSPDVLLDVRADANVDKMDLCDPRRQQYETLVITDDGFDEDTGDEEGKGTDVRPAAAPADGGVDSEYADSQSDASSICSELSDLGDIRRLAEMDNWAPAASIDLLRLKRTAEAEAAAATADDERLCDKLDRTKGAFGVFALRAEHLELEARLMAAFDVAADGMRRLECRKYASTATFGDEQEVDELETYSQDSDDMVLVENEMESMVRREQYYQVRILLSGCLRRQQFV